MQFGCLFFLFCFCVGGPFFCSFSSVSAAYYTVFATRSKEK